MMASATQVPTAAAPPATEDNEKNAKFLEYISKQSDLSQHEEQVTKQPYNVSFWLSYLETLDDHIQTAQQQASSDEAKKKDSSASTTAATHISMLAQLRDWTGRRAVTLLPRSYKLWKNHWEFCLLAFKSKWAVQEEVQVVLACFERCLWTLSDFPRVWVEYLTFIKNNPGCMTVTNMRRTVNKSLQALALTQHEKSVWPVVVEWMMSTTSTAKKTAAAAAEEEETGDTRNVVHMVTADLATNSPSTAWQIPLETRICLLRRYCNINPLYKRDFAEFLVTHQRWGEAAVQYQALLNAQTNVSDTSRRNEDWQAFATLCSQHPVEVQQAGVHWEAIVRSVLGGSGASDKKSSKPNADAKDKDAATVGSLGGTEAAVLMQGILWTQLADSWIRQGSFEIARSIYEEGLQKVQTVRDFSILYNAYLQFEEGLLEAVTSSINDEDGDDDATEGEGGGDDWDILLQETTSSKLADMELAMARAEHLTSRRPLMLNAVLLRQNPHNVGHWLQRAELYVKLDGDGDGDGDGERAGGDSEASEVNNKKKKQAGKQAAAAALEEALATVVASKAVNGSPSQLVTTLTKLYQEEESPPAKARDLLDRICRQGVYQFQKVDDLANCWATWVELELSNEKYTPALNLAREAVAPSSSTAGRRAAGGGKPLNLTKSLRLWDLLLDLEESLGTVQTTKDAYNRALEIKAATVQHVLNYASFLTDREYYEESFTAYERGLELFSFPHHAGAKLLWKAYLTAFTNRYSKKGGNSNSSKVERCRDLFQRCIEQCPPEETASFFMMQGEFEEAYGLTKRALSVYRQMCQTVPASEKHVAYQLWIAKTTKYLGLTATREIYQQAVETLKDQDASKMCIEFANMETQLSEHERARAIWAYGAQMSDPRRLPEYWKAWNEFEIAHGNEETFREMLRIKRSVEAAFSTVNYNVMDLADHQPKNLSDEQAMQMIASQEGVEHRAAQNSIAGFVSGKRTVAAANLEDVEARAAKLRKAAGEAVVGNISSSGDAPHADNDDEDEIDLDDIDAEIEEAAAAGAKEEEEQEEAHANKVEDVSTKAVPAAVFGGLAEGKDPK